MYYYKTTPRILIWSLVPSIFQLSNLFEVRTSVQYDVLIYLNNFKHSE